MNRSNDLAKVEQSWAYIFQLALAKFDKPAHLEISHQRHMAQIGHVLKKGIGVF